MKKISMKRSLKRYVKAMQEIPKKKKKRVADFWLSLPKLGPDFAGKYIVEEDEEAKMKKNKKKKKQVVDQKKQAPIVSPTEELVVSQEITFRFDTATKPLPLVATLPSNNSGDSTEDDAEEMCRVCKRKLQEGMVCCGTVLCTLDVCNECFRKVSEMDARTLCRTLSSRVWKGYSSRYCGDN